jgi:AcrR family transcriptional regulator
VRRERRLDRILDAGATLLHERGFHGCTMRHLARGSGTSLANLYHYVGGKEDLLYQVERRILEAAVASVQAVLAVGGKDRLKALVADHIRRVRARPLEARALDGGPTPLRGDKARRVEELRRRYHVAVKAAVEAAVRRRAGARDGELLASLLLGMANRAATDGGRARASASADRLASRVVGVFLGGASR